MTMNGFKGSRTARLALIGLMALAASGAVTAARAQEEGEFAKSLLGSIGLIPESKAPIDYRERPPLVLPKGGKQLALPPPVDSGYGERKLANWPNDPDVAAARERKAENKKLRTQTDDWNANRADARLPPEQLKATRSAGRDPEDRTPVNAANPNMNASGWIPPEKLQKMGRSSTEETAPGEEPTRKSLSDPPAGYRKAAGGGSIKPSYAPPDLEDPGSAYYLQDQKRKREEQKY